MIIIRLFTCTKRPFPFFKKYVIIKKIWGETMSETKKKVTKKTTKTVSQKKNTTQTTRRKKIEKELIIPTLEPSKTVDFNEFEEHIDMNTKEWKEKREKLLREHEMRLHKKEAHEEEVIEDDDSKKDSNLILMLFITLIIILISFVFVRNLYNNEADRQKKDTEALNQLEDNTNQDDETEEVKVQTMTCTTNATQMENYQSSVLSISTFQDGNLTTYEYIVTRKYNDQGSYDSAKLASQNQNDIIFDNNQLAIKTYFGNGHMESVPQETTYFGKTVQEVKAQEEATGATCTLSE